MDLSRWKVTRAAFGAVSKLLELQLRGDGDEGDDDGATPADDAIFYQQLGVAVRPVVARTLRALGVEDGDEVAVLKLWDRASTPTDLEAGETRVYAAGAISVFLRLLTTQAVLQAATILLGTGATKGVNREGDPLTPGSLTVAVGTPVLNTPAPGVNTVPLTITYTPPAPAPPQVITLGLVATALVITPASPAVQTITLGGITGAGSTKVRAVD
jgi:hypothetical protein